MFCRKFVGRVGRMSVAIGGMQMGDLKDSLSEVTLTKLAAIAGAAVGARLDLSGAAVGAFVGYTLASAVQTTGRTASCRVEPSESLVGKGRILKCRNRITASGRQS